MTWLMIQVFDVLYLECPRGRSFYRELVATSVM